MCCHVHHQSSLKTSSSLPLKFIPLQPSCDTYKYSFWPRTIIDWNSLPPDYLTLDSISKFKAFLSYQDLWIVMAASFSSQDKRIPPPLLPLEVLPFSQSVTKKVNEMIIHIFHHVLNSHVNQLQQIKEIDEKERGSNPMGLSWTSTLPQFNCFGKKIWPL